VIERRPAHIKFLGPIPPAASVAFTSDPALQTSVSTALSTSTTAGLNFDGVGVGLGSFAPNSAPADTNGAVGATQYVQWVNESFAVFDKTGVLQYGPAAG